MVDSSSNKIPFVDIQNYVEEHDDLITSLIKFEKRGLISIDELEVKFAKSLMKIQESISNIFKKNNIQEQHMVKHDKKFLELFSD